MRHALGLLGEATTRSQPTHSTTPVNGTHPQRRRFVRDGEVPVTVIHRDEATGTNQLEVARQTIRSLTAAREHSERLLAEAQAAVQHLRTELAHERLAKDEAVTRADARTQAAEQACQSAQAELAAERDARRQAEARLSASLEARREAEERLRDAVAAQPVQIPSQPRRRGRPRKNGDNATTPPSAPMVEPTAKHAADEAVEAPVKSPTTGRTAGSSKADTQPAQPRRRGRPPKDRPPEAEYVEWWKPGWKARLR
jgi:hypothetical protein